MAASTTGRLHFLSLLTFLVLCMFLLTGRLVYVLVLCDIRHFPLNTVKVSATYEHITRQQLESILAPYLNDGFFSLSATQLRQDLLTLPWTEDALVKRIWPDTIQIVLVEKKPILSWNGDLMTGDGSLFHVKKAEVRAENLPKLTGPIAQQKDVLQNYEKLSKLLSEYGLSLGALTLSDNQAWDLTLTNGVLVRLGKHDHETRLRRFCRAYPAVFADKAEQLASVDLRYTRGMAVQWKQPVGR